MSIEKNIERIAVSLEALVELQKGSTPVAPVGPVKPTGPCGPVGPVGPVLPVLPIAAVDPDNNILLLPPNPLGIMRFL